MEAALRPLLFLSKFLGLSIREYNSNMKVNKYLVFRCIITYLIYVWGFIQGMYLLNSEIYIKNTLPVIRIGNQIESITSFVLLNLLYLFTISQEVSRTKIWAKIVYVDSKLASIGIQVCFEKVKSFTLKTTVITVGMIIIMQGYQSIVQGYYFGVSGYTFGIQTTASLLVTFAAVLQFQLILYLLSERLDLINTNLEHILKYRHGLSKNKIKYLAEVQIIKQSLDEMISNNKEQEKIKKNKGTRKTYVYDFLSERAKIMKTNFEIKSQLTAFNCDPAFRVSKLLNMLMDILEWGEQVKSTYEIPMLICIILLFITSVFKMYLAVTKFQRMVYGLDFETLNTYLTTIAIQCVIHTAILLLIYFIQACTKKVRELKNFEFYNIHLSITFVLILGKNHYTNTSPISTSWP